MSCKWFSFSHKHLFHQVFEMYISFEKSSFCWVVLVTGLKLLIYVWRPEKMGWMLPNRNSRHYQLYKFIIAVVTFIFLMIFSGVYILSEFWNYSPPLSKVFPNFSIKIFRKNWKYSPLCDFYSIFYRFLPFYGLLLPFLLIFSSLFQSYFTFSLL